MFYREIFKERMNMKFCSNCGKQLNDDAMFCSGCASKQVAAPHPQQPVNGNNAAPVNNYNAAPVPAKRMCSRTEVLHGWLMRLCFCWFPSLQERDRNTANSM